MDLWAREVAGLPALVRQLRLGLAHAKSSCEFCPNLPGSASSVCPTGSVDLALTFKRELGYRHPQV
jgi:hypothetical protein